jgi:hypothetical protein
MEETRKDKLGQWTVREAQLWAALIKLRGFVQSEADNDCDCQCCVDVKAEAKAALADMPAHSQPEVDDGQT